MKVPIANINYEYDEELSLRDFTNWEFLSRPEYDFNNKVIYGSCFLQEIPDREIFRNVQGAVFIGCNLDNVLIPEGNEVIQCSQKRFKAQNDKNDWEIDEENNPVQIVNSEMYEKFHIESPTPEEIPEEEVPVPIDWLKIKQE